MVESMPIEADDAPIKRGPGRPPLRQKEALRPDTRSDSAREADEYARQIMEQLGDAGIYDANEFDIPRELWPDGWEYQWRRMETLGKPDHYNVLSVSKNGWRPVMASRHPDKMPAGYEGHIIVKGLGLYELPSVLADRRRIAENREAQDVLRNAEAALHDAPPNTAPRDDEGLKRAGLNTVKRELMRPVGGDD